MAQPPNAPCPLALLSVPYSTRPVVTTSSCRRWPCCAGPAAPPARFRATCRPRWPHAATTHTSRVRTGSHTQQRAPSSCLLFLNTTSPISTHLSRDAVPCPRLDEPMDECPFLFLTHHHGTHRLLTAAEDTLLSHHAPISAPNTLNTVASLHSALPSTGRRNSVTGSGWTPMNAESILITAERIQ